MNRRTGALVEGLDVRAADGRLAADGSGIQPRGGAMVDEWIEGGLPTTRENTR